MISKSTLQKAAEQNLINPEQLEPLYDFLQNQTSAAESDSDTDGDNKEEPLKFIRSFGDVFITLGVVLLVVSINMTELSGYYYLLPAACFVAVAEWLVRVRRLALPGIAILLAILYFIHKAINFDNANATTFELGVLSASSLLFYIRYRMPFSLLPFAAGLVAMALIQIGLDVIKNPVIFAGFGVLVFAVALWFDAQDTIRKTHLSDNAFWLHLLASPLIVHGLMVTLLTSDQSWLTGMGVEVLMIIFFAAFFLLALLVDRRAMLISTQLYMIYALTQLFNDRASGAAASAQEVTIYVLIGLGLFVIYFGTYWYKTRQIVYGFLSGSTISHYVPALDIQDTKG